MRRASALTASVLAMSLVSAACGGGGGGGGGGGTAVTGTAAMGAAIAGATITLVDATGATATATTAVNGTFTVNTTGLTPPFMIKLVSGGTTLFSVSAEASADTVVNVTPLTDLILRTWYDVQGVDVAAAFAAPVADPPPSPQAVEVIGQVVQRIVQLWLDQAGVSGDFDIISTPFTADGAGVDQVLDWTTVDTTTGGITLDGASLTVGMPRGVPAVQSAGALALVNGGAIYQGDGTLAPEHRPEPLPVAPVCAGPQTLTDWLAVWPVSTILAVLG